MKYNVVLIIPNNLHTPFLSMVMFSNQPDTLFDLARLVRSHFHGLLMVDGSLDRPSAIARAFIAGIWKIVNQSLFGFDFRRLDISFGK